MASKSSPEAHGSPILVATITTAGVLLLLEAMYRLPNIIAALQPGAYPAPALVAILFAVIFVVALENRVPSLAKQRNNGIQK